MKRFVILERDNWTCQLCGIATPRELRGTTHPHAPEIGHIIPRTRGGGDEPENLRCECKSCNHQKAGYLDGELHLENFMMVPAPDDVVAMMAATEAQRIGNRIGARRMNELHPELVAEGGRKGGRKAGGMNAKNKTGFCGRTAEQMSKDGRKAGRASAKWAKEHPEEAFAQRSKAGSIAGRKNVESGHWASLRTTEHQSNSARIRNHNQYHLNRGRISSSCKLCTVGVKDFVAFTELERVLKAA